MSDTLKVVDAEALARVYRRICGRHAMPVRLHLEYFEEILADITTDDLSPAHRQQYKNFEDALTITLEELPDA